MCVKLSTLPDVRLYITLPCNVTRAKMGQYVARNLQQNSSFKMKTIISLK